MSNQPTNGKPVEITPEAIAKIAESGTFADFEAARSGRPVEAQTVDGQPEDPTRAAAETADENGDPDAGENAGNEPHDDLPKGVKRRLRRAKDKETAARAEAEAWRKRYETLQAEKAGGEQPEGGQQEQQRQPEEVSDDPLPADEYNFDYPEESDYVSGPEDAEGLTLFLEDVDRWEASIPLKGGKHRAPAGQGGDPNAGGRDNGQQAPSQQQDHQAGQGTQLPADEPTVEQTVHQLFADLRETLDEAEEEGDETLAEDFFAQLQAGKFQLSMEMLQWMADHDEAAKVARQFVASPRKANRLFRNPPTKHGSLLNEMVKEGGGRRSRQTDNRDGKTVVRDLNGRRPADPQKALAHVAQHGSFAEYEAMRRGKGA